MTIVIAHRGASYDKKENTIEAFEHAKTLLADWIELDVRRTRDGVLVVSHDPQVTDDLVICETDMADLPEYIPTLNEALRASHPLGVNVEIKNIFFEPGYDETDRLAKETLDVIAQACRELSPFGILVSSFDYQTLQQIKALDRSIDTAFLYMSEEQNDAAIELSHNGGHQAVHPHDDAVTSEFVGACHEAELLVNVWTVDNPARIVELAAMGVDGIVTNRPDIARRALGR